MRASLRRATGYDERKGGMVARRKALQQQVCLAAALRSFHALAATIREHGFKQTMMRRSNRMVVWECFE